MVIHDEANHKFTMNFPEGTPYLEYSLDGGVFTVLHTVVPKELGGRGLAAELATAAYDWAAKNNFILKSECSYMTAWLKRNHS